ncbi:MAG: electron transfer flavoprotein subunit beta/FixA family protein [Thermomicrobiales bacterium]|nr:electron transfer flavoprotein subunit beta/FixA family protein [Thermomicrobiales bacterium]
MPYTIVVLVKQVPDMNTVRVDKASGKPMLSGQLAISSYDDYAIEEALRVKEAHGGEIVVVAAGAASVKDAVARALAMGADRGVILQVEPVNELDTLQVAGLLAEKIRSVSPDIIFAGQNSDDYSTGQVGPQIAELLGVPSLGSIASVEANGEVLTVIRDTEDGRQTIEVQTPVVLMAQAGLNEPRYPSLKGIMAAKKKPLETHATNVPVSNRSISWGEPYAPERASSGIMVQDQPAAEAAKQLVAWLREQKLV